MRTSARLNGRAARGLAVDIAVATWAERRRYNAADFPVGRLLEAKGASSVTVIIPTKQCAATIAGVLRETVGPLAPRRVVDEVVVVDAASTDGTAEVARSCGARVLQQDELLPESGRTLGQGRCDVARRWPRPAETSSAFSTATRPTPILGIFRGCWGRC